MVGEGEDGLGERAFEDAWVRFEYVLEGLGALLEGGREGFDEVFGGEEIAAEGVVVGVGDGAEEADGDLERDGEGGAAIVGRGPEEVFV